MYNVKGLFCSERIQLCNSLGEFKHLLGHYLGFMAQSWFALAINDNHDDNHDL